MKKLKTKSLSLMVKPKTEVLSYSFSALARTWTLKADEDQKRADDAFKMRTYQRMLRTPTLDGKMYKYIIFEQAMDMTAYLLYVYYQRVLSFFGHIIRRQDNRPEKLIIQDIIEEKWSGGRFQENGSISRLRRSLINMTGTTGARCRSSQRMADTSERNSCWV